jgi:hypothetical protein
MKVATSDLAAFARARMPPSRKRAPMRGPAVALLVAMLASACATRDPNEYYDAAAKETMGRIVSKQVVAIDRRPTAEVNNTLFIPVMLHGVAYLVMLGNPLADRASIRIYEYVVRTPDGATTSVPSEYFAFEVGQCVKLFTSTRPSYPRIASGWNCP